MSQKYVVITQTNGEMPQAERDSYLPNAYPRRCVEVMAESAEEVQAKFPNRSVFTEQAYTGYQAAMETLFKEAEAEKQKSLIGRLFG